MITRYSYLLLALLALAPACFRTKRRRPSCEECGKETVQESRRPRKVIRVREPNRVSGPQGWGSMRNER